MPQQSVWGCSSVWEVAWAVCIITCVLMIVSSLVHCTANLFYWFNLSFVMQQFFALAFIFFAVSALLVVYDCKSHRVLV